MKLTYAQIRDQRFNEVLTKLIHAPMAVKESKRLLDFAYRLREEQQKASELADILKNKVQGQDLTHDHPDVKEYLATEVEFDFEPFDHEILADVKLSAADLALLEGIVK